jgi:L-lactate dehydrogenase (cytochrome)
MGESVDGMAVVRELNSKAGWEDIAWLRDLWPGKLAIKGVMNSDEVEQAVRLGIDGISVSNHGGNQLDEAGSTIAALPDVVATAAGRVEVLFDGGVRTGQDVLKALALGARGCLLGRAPLYALGAAREAGVSRLLAIIRTELDVSLGLTGLRCVEEASPAVLTEPGVRLSAS